MKIIAQYTIGNHYLFCISIALLISVGCGEQSHHDTQSTAGYSADTKQTLKIDYPTGTLLPESIFKSKVPTLFNVGKFTDNVFGMLLGPPLATHEAYQIDPIGAYLIVKDSTQLAFVLCKSDQLQNDNVDDESYNSWSLNEIQYKNLIAAWFKTNCELSNCSNMEWANDLKALRILENVE